MGEKERGIKQLKNSKQLIACSQTTDDVDKNSEDHNSIKKRKGLILFDDMIVSIWKLIIIDRYGS